MAPGVISLDRSDARAAVVVLYGEHEAYDSPRLSRHLESLFREGMSVVVDLSRTTFLDSTTLVALMQARNQAERRGLGFALQMDSSTGEYVYRTFELTRLSSVFPIFSTRAEALEAARARRSAPERETGEEAEAESA